MSSSSDESPNDIELERLLDDVCAITKELRAMLESAEKPLLYDYAWCLWRLSMASEARAVFCNAVAPGATVASYLKSADLAWVIMRQSDSAVQVCDFVPALGLAVDEFIKSSKTTEIAPHMIRDALRAARAR